MSYLMRVYDIAVMLGITSAEVKSMLLLDFNINVESAATVIEPLLASTIIDHYL